MADNSSVTLSHGVTTGQDALSDAAGEVTEDLW